MSTNTRWEQFNLIVDNEMLDIKEKGLLLILFRFADIDTNFEWSYPSIEKLKKLYGTKRNETIYKILNVLYEKNIVTKRVGPRNRNEYRINLDSLINESLSEKCDIPKSGHSPKNGKRAFPKNGQGVFPKNGKQKETIKEKEKKYIYSDFDVKEIVNVYPGKKIKATRDKKLPSILNKYGIEQIKRCVERYANECNGKEDRFILNESTFWNGRYIDYLDCNYEEKNKIKKVKEYDKATDIEELEAIEF